MVDLRGDLEPTGRGGAVPEDPAGVVGQHVDPGRTGRVAELTGQAAHVVQPREVRHEGLRSRRAGHGCGLVRDRKSTRLNSSHVAISYAVFCLKKKNPTN